MNEAVLPKPADMLGAKVKGAIKVWIKNKSHGLFAWF
jgi:hypothetical protein